MMETKDKLKMHPDISVIVPIYNEQDSIPHLVSELSEVLDQLDQTAEVLLVDDGSYDRSLELLRELIRNKPDWRVVSFRRNFGQTAAMMAGIDYATGEIIITLDADLQNDPRDIPKLLAKLDEGFDIVSGWRKNRQDHAIRRKLVSVIANKLIARSSGVQLRDIGCTLKAYRADMLRGVRLYGEMHRFAPIYAVGQGAKIAEVPVNHRARKFGQSKYGLERVVKVLLDLLVVKFLERFMVKPIYVFGSFGLLSLALGLISFVTMIVLKIFYSVPMILTPLPLVTVMGGLLGVMSILMGLIAEMVVRTYFESQQRAAYTVRETFGFDQGSQ